MTRATTRPLDTVGAQTGYVVNLSHRFRTVEA
jgi:hypothetical protein